MGIGRDLKREFECQVNWLQACFFVCLPGVLFAWFGLPVSVSLSVCLWLSGLSSAGRLMGVGSLGFRSLVGFVFCSSLVYDVPCCTYRGALAD